VSETCFNCGHDITDICKEDVLSVVGEDGVTLNAVMSLARGTIAKRSKLVRSMIRSGELTLTTERTLHLPGTV